MSLCSRRLFLFDLNLCCFFGFILKMCATNNQTHWNDSLCFGLEHCRIEVFTVKRAEFCVQNNHNHMKRKSLPSFMPMPCSVYRAHNVDTHMHIYTFGFMLLLCICHCVWCCVCAICSLFSWLHANDCALRLYELDRLADWEPHRPNTENHESEKETRARCSVLAFWSDAVVLVCNSHSIRYGYGCCCCYILCLLFSFALSNCTAYSRLFGQSLNQLAHVTAYIQSDFLSFRGEFFLVSHHTHFFTSNSYTSNKRKRIFPIFFKTFSLHAKIQVNIWSIFYVICTKHLQRISEVLIISKEQKLQCVRQTK